MDEDNRYTIFVAQMSSGRWELVLFVVRANKDNDKLCTRLYAQREGLPDIVRTKMTIVDMGDNINPRARMVEGVGSRYQNGESPTYEAEAEQPIWQYFLHDITMKQIKQMRLLP